MLKKILVNTALIIMVFLILVLSFVLLTILTEGTVDIYYALGYGVLLTVWFVILPLLPVAVLWNYFFLKNRNMVLVRVNKIITISTLIIIVIATLNALFEIFPRGIDIDVKEWFSAVLMILFLSAMLRFYFKLLYKWVKPLY